MIVPLLLLPKRIAKQLSHNLLGVASRIKPNFKFLEADFYKLDSDINVDEYVALCILNSLTYFLFPPCWQSRSWCAWATRTRWE